MIPFNLIRNKDREILEAGKKLVSQIQEFVKDRAEKDVYEFPTYNPTDIELKLVECFDEANLPELAPHFIYIASCMLGGVSNMLVAPPASGKTKIMKCLKNVMNVKECDRVKDIAGLKNVIQNNSDNYLVFDDLTNIVFTSQTDTPSMLFTALSSIIQQHTFVDPETNTEFKNVNLALVGGCTHQALEKLARNPVWNSMVSSRILRYYILYYRRPEPEKYVADDFFPELPKIDVNWNVKIEDSFNIRDACKIYSALLPYERTTQFVYKIMKGHAMLCGKDSITADDLNWLLLYEPCITAETYIREKDEITQNRLVTLYAMHKVIEPELKLVANEARISLDVVRGEMMELSGLLKFNVGQTSYQLKSEFSQRLKHLYEIYGYVFEEEEK